MEKWAKGVKGASGEEGRGGRSSPLSLRNLGRTSEEMGRNNRALFLFPVPFLREEPRTREGNRKGGMGCEKKEKRREERHPSSVRNLRTSGITQEKGNRKKENAFPSFRLSCPRERQKTSGKGRVEGEERKEEEREDRSHGQ